MFKVTRRHFGALLLIGFSFTCQVDRICSVIRQGTINDQITHRLFNCLKNLSFALLSYCLLQIQLAVFVLILYNSCANFVLFLWS